MAGDRDQNKQKPFLYETVKNDILAMIRSRGMKAHDALPSEGGIARTYHVSKMTGKLALKSLEEDGIVYRVDRRGSFLADGFESRLPHQIAPGSATRIDKAGRQLSIALVVPVFDFYTGDIIASIHAEAEKRSMRVFLHMSDEDPAKEDQILSELSHLPYIQGIILFPTSRAELSSELLSLKLVQYPLVLVDRTFETLAFDSVRHTHYQGGHDMTAHMIKKGHRNVGFVSGPLATSRSREQRYQGYLHALMEYGAQVKKSHIQFVDGDIHSTHGCHVLDSPSLPVLREYLLANRQVTAVFCADDYVALELYYAAVTAGIRVPEDLSIAGFSDNRVLRFAPIRFSTVRQPTETVGPIALDLLTRRLTDPAQNHAEILVDTQIIDRDSILDLTENIRIGIAENKLH